METVFVRKALDINLLQMTPDVVHALPLVRTVESPIATLSVSNVLKTEKKSRTQMAQRLVATVRLVSMKLLIRSVNHVMILVPSVLAQGPTSVKNAIRVATENF